MSRKFIFDSDGGVDDAQALIMLVANGKVPDLITTVFGNVGRDQATTNLLAVCAHLGVDIPVHMGADRPLTQPIIDAKYVHGDDGLGGARRPAQQAQPASDDGVGVLCSTFGDAAAKGERVDILMIGPLTNLALALRLASYDLLRADGDDPILILDDVFAELDAERRAQLADLVAGAEQVLVTAAVAADVPAGLAGTRYDVAGGTVVRADDD